MSNDVRIRPAEGGLKGRLILPGDKSISHRVGFFGALSSEGITAENFSSGADCASTLRCLELAGCLVERIGDKVRVRRGMHPGEIKAPLDAGNSGTTARLLCGLLAGTPGVFAVITGDESLRKRPMGRVVSPLRTLGARIDGPGGGAYLPLSIRGGCLSGGTFELPMASAQVKTALILAGLNAHGSVTVVEPAKSRDHSERLLRHLGVPLRQEDNRITVYPCSDLPGCSIRVPGDFSSAAFWITGALIVPGSDIVLENVGINPTRTGFLECLKKMGASIEIEEKEPAGGEPVGKIRVRYSELEGIEVEKDAIPTMIDELPLLALIATQAHGITKITHAEELRVKESDRISSMAKGLRALGADVEELEDGFFITGPTLLGGGCVESSKDHRIAMTFSIAALAAQDEIIVKDAQCVGISYPEFFDHLSMLSEGVKDLEYKR